MNSIVRIIFIYFLKLYVSNQNYMESKINIRKQSENIDNTNEVTMYE